MAQGATPAAPPTPRPSGRSVPGPSGATTAAQPVIGPEQVTGAQSIVRSLEEAGVEVVFGIPGGAILPTYDPLMDSAKVRHILVRHEQGGGHAASGYALATGRVGVTMATSGPGATNLVTALADANMDSVPVVAITGQVGASLIGTDAFQEADIVGITLPVTKHNYLVTDPDDIPRVIAEAFHIASTGRPGPVLVDIAQWHGFDQSEVEPLSMRPAHQIRDFVLVMALERHGVDLDVEASLRRGLDAVQDLGQFAPAGDAPEKFGVECIQRDIDASHAGIGKALRIAGELAAIGGERDFLQPIADPPAQPFEQRHHILAHQGLAAGDAQPLHTLVHKDQAEPLQFLKCEHLRLGQKAHMLAHAIDTAKIAAVRHRDAQIGDGTAETVLHAGRIACFGDEKALMEPEALHLFHRRRPGKARSFR